MSTREQILDTAIRLFNEEGTGPVSTNHIARALGISPGNLYYHFRNKEAIIRAIFARLRPEWEAAFQLPADRPATLADAGELLDRHFAIVWAYRFYYRELPALLRQDAELAAAYREVRQAGLLGVEALLAEFAAGGEMTIPPEHLPGLARNIWLMADGWLPFAELGEDSATVDLRQGRSQILLLLEPYLTSPGGPGP